MIEQKIIMIVTTTDIANAVVVKNFSLMVATIKLINLLYWLLAQKNVLTSLFITKHSTL